MVSQTDPIPSLGDLEVSLKERTTAFAVAAAAAQKAVTDLRERKEELGVAQRALDAVIIEMRRAAPCDSHWGGDPYQAESAIERRLLAAE